MPSASLRLAVIGAGAAGLAAARELRREGHAPVVFERAAAVGGTWLYTPPASAADPLGAAATHSSLYASLRTNLPRETMGFLDFPFSAAAPGSADPRRFPGHEEVLRYLEAFARRFDLHRLVRFETEVVSVRRDPGGSWAVTSRKLGEKGSGEEEVYDAVVVCNGHYTEPRIAVIPGVDAWPGQQMHSHNYRVPEPFLDQVVIIIGASASAFDISRDISNIAKEVHIADRSVPASTCEKQPGYDNLWLHSMDNGNVVFQDGSSIKADVIMHCTGYLYDFPFLGNDSTITVDDNCVDPLYKHVFPPEVAPQLSFIGLQWKVIPFPLFELQSKWVAGVLSGRIELPSKEEMMEDVKAFYAKLETCGWPKRYTHNFSNYQFEYGDWLAEQCGHPPIEEWRKLMYAANARNKVARPESYRDKWDDDHLVADAHEDFNKYL
ncbi:flavin-containing monooxygenase FMO GS-OX-like 3 isoform X2 [Phragmites australis]|uniref:flavin-containing monooxygenase FMO GS-OX-like 3 isoform X2 n=1 Tax=Phragmites australis TaxID=29695 RepID=UPI002D796509|nr:flavin-containing monooxygenase FMO GS-OX-like 3 isoform X2 [Phragmites australis]